jgi:hypothetical protein
VALPTPPRRPRREFPVHGTGGAPTGAPPPDVSFPATGPVFGDESTGPAGSTPDSSRWTANAVGGDWPGPPTGATVFPQRMPVDYVRVHQ